LKHFYIVLIASILLAGGLVLNVHPVVQAAAPGNRGTTIIQTEPTILKLQPVASQPLGKSFQVTAILTTASGEPIVDETINFLVGGLFEGQARTDTHGQASITVNTNYPAGSYTLKAIYQGTRAYQPSAGTTDLTISPFILEVQTVPSLPGVNFKLGDQVFSSGSDGIARVPVNRAGTYTLQVLPLNNPGSNQRIEFNRWVDEVFTPYRNVIIPIDKPIQVGLEVSYKVSQTFVDLQNHPVDLSRITSITMKSSQGTTYTFNDGQARWLPASLVTRRVGGLDVVQIQYSVMNVQVDGSNVVSQAQQRFYGHPGDIWTIQLLLFSAQISAKDAFLGSPVGKSILLQYPDGTRQVFKFSKDNSVTVNSLARGIYSVQVQGVAGFTPSTPVALSQNQVMNLSVLTRLDIFLAVTLGTLFALGLIYIGRAKLLNQRKAPNALANPRQLRQRPGLKSLQDHKS
jgi:hypothetical protein